MRIGIFGGTFDPPHVAHLIVAEQVLNQLELDEIWMMPVSLPPHKSQVRVTDARHRLSMVEKAVASHPQISAFPFEVERGGVSYTYDTVCELRLQYPDHEFYFVIGADMVEYLPHWHNIRELLGMVQFVAVSRPAYSLEQPFADAGHSIIRVEVPQMEISSSYIREKVGKKESIRYLVPDAVRQFIEENQIYE